MFEMKCLKTILWFTLLDYVWNERIKQALKVEKTIIDIIHKKTSAVIWPYLSYTQLKPFDLRIDVATD